MIYLYSFRCFIQRMFHHAHQIGPALFLWGGSSTTSSFTVMNTGLCPFLYLFIHTQLFPFFFSFFTITFSFIHSFFLSFFLSFFFLSLLSFSLFPDDRSWYPLTPSSSVAPPLLHRFASCYDAQNKRVIVHGGVDILAPTQTQYSTWIYQCDLCSEHPSCKTCAEDTENSCVWCSTKGRCITGPTHNANIPSADTKQNENNFENTTQFPHSEPQSSPYLPLSISQPPSESCSVYVSDSAKCPAEDCASYTDCSSCIQHARCGWCKELQSYPYSAQGCFEGSASGPYLGTCSRWGSQGANCDELKIDLDVFLPYEGEKVVAGETLNVALHTVGIIDTNSLHYRCYVTYPNQMKQELQHDLSARGYFAWSIPCNVQGNCPLDFVSVADNKETAVLTRTVEIVKGALEFSHPKQDEIVESDDYVVTWKTPFDAPSTLLFPISLRVYNNDKLVVSLLSSAQNDFQYKWHLSPLQYPDSKNYSLELIWHIKQSDDSFYEQIVGKTGSFTIKLPPTNYTLLAPSADDALLSGSEIELSWESNRMPEHTSIYLLRGMKKEQADLVQALALSLPNNQTTLKWKVDVEYDSEYYFFRLENSDNSSVYSDSSHFIIKKPYILVVFTDVSDTHQSDSRIIGTRVSVQWKYIGSPTTFNVSLLSSSGTQIHLKTTSSEEENSYSFLLTSKLKHSELYGVQVEAINPATKFSSKLIGETAPFRVLAPCASAVRSIGSIVTVSLIAFVVVAAFLVFYCLVYRRSRLGGFQQI